MFIRVIGLILGQVFLDGSKSGIVSALVLLIVRLYLSRVKSGSVTRSGENRVIASVLNTFWLNCGKEKSYRIMDASIYLNDILRQQEYRTSELSRDTDYVRCIQLLILICSHRRLFNSITVLLAWDQMQTEQIFSNDPNISRRS